MWAYHVATREPSPYDPMGFEYFNLDSLLIEDAFILIGYGPDDERKGRILSYPCPSTYSERFLGIVNGDKSIRGDFISKINLDEDIVSRIKRNYNPLLESGEKIYHLGKEVFLGWNYKGTTQELVHILSDGLIKNDGGKRKTIKERLFKAIFPVLEPLPSFL